MRIRTEHFCACSVRARGFVAGSWRTTCAIYRQSHTDGQKEGSRGVLPLITLTNLIGRSLNMIPPPTCPLVAKKSSAFVPTMATNAEHRTYGVLVRREGFTFRRGEAL